MTLEQPETEVFFADIFDGYLSCLDFLKTEGCLVFSFEVSQEAPPSDDAYTLLKIVSNDFCFALAHINNGFVVQRNNTVNTLTLDGIDLSSSIKVLVSWTHNYISISAGKSGEEKKTSKAPTIATVPPIELIQWARRNNLLPVKSIPDSQDFRRRVHDALTTISQKIEEADAYKSFWNISYKGNKIDQITPKKEVELQPLIHCFLHDQMLAGGIEVVAEPHNGSGNVDFLFLASINGKIEKICLEVKLAHSKDLEHGYFSQLPKYMRSHNATFGIYCIMNFCGNWFNEPTFKLTDSASFYLGVKERDHSIPELEKIRIFEIKLSKGTSASKKA